MSLFSCNGLLKKDTRKKVLRLVNDQNDGFNAFNINFWDDHTYSTDNLSTDKSGRYSIAGNVIILDSAHADEERIAFDKNMLGCMYHVRYVTKKDTTDTRVIFDSLFCNHIPLNNFVGKWKYEKDIVSTDTIWLNSNGTEYLNESAYKKWDVDNAELYLTKNNTAERILIINLEDDSLWFSTDSRLKNVHVFKATRIK